MSFKKLTLSPDSLADNSDQPKVLKMQDIDTWTREELINYINTGQVIYERKPGLIKR